MQETIINLINDYGYIAIALLICVENVFPPIPSEVILLFGGFMTVGTDMNIFWVIVASTIGALLGAVILYYAGRLLGYEKIIKFVNSKYGRFLFLKEKNINKAVDYFNKRSAKTVLFCRCLPILRSLISIPAGMVKMPFWGFLFLTALGSAVWNTFLTVAGAITGDNWGAFLSLFEKYSKLILVLVVLLFVAFILVKRIIKKKKEK